MLGIGRNGHIGFNEPGTPFDSRTRVTHLAASTRADNARSSAVARSAGAMFGTGVAEPGALASAGDMGRSQHVPLKLEEC